MGLTAIMAVSAMSVSAFAEESDALLATVPTENGNVVEVYQSDVANGGYVVDCGSYTVTIDGNRSTVAVIGGNSIQRANTGVFKTGFPTASRAVSATSTWDLTFSNTRGQTKYTPYQYTPVSQNNSIAYHFQADNSYGTKVYATIYCVDNSAYQPVTLYLSDTDKHSVGISGMVSGNCTYATVTNNSYSGTATGTCEATN